MITTTLSPSLCLENAAAKQCREGVRWFGAHQVIGRRPNLPGIVNLTDKKHAFLARAFCSPGSRYFLRVITTHEVPIDRAYWRARIQAAFERRAAIAKQTDAYRVVHAESDGVPGVVIDKYNDVWAIQVSASGAATILKDLCSILEEEFHPAAIVERGIGHQQEETDSADRILFGTTAVTTIREEAQRFQVDALHGQKTGAYLDYRAFRLAARAWATGDCLDACCYQGWFACQIAFRAETVTAVDSSAQAIAVARDNAALNHHANISFVTADVFDYLAACDRRFHFVHLDPPSFAKGGGQREAAVRGYEKLLRLAIPRVEPPGVLMVSACSHAISEGVLERTVARMVERAGRKGEVLFRGIQDRDHPVLPGFPESLYLKAIAVKILALPTGHGAAEKESF